MKRLRVLVVDDSALVRLTVRNLVEVDPRFEVVGQAVNGAEALEMAARLAPDVVTLDLDMPVMDGLTALPRLVNEYRQRVVILSTLATANAYPTFKALALGAVDFVTKPGTGTYLRGLDELGETLREKLLIAARVPREKLGRFQPRTASAAAGSPRPNPVKTPVAFPYPRPEVVVGVGGSTGATTALEAILTRLPPTFQGALVIVQHLPVGFSRPFARYLATLCPFEVKEAEDGEKLTARTAYLAPGGCHLRVQRSDGEVRLRLDPASAPLHGYRPAVDALFYSLAIAERSHCAGVLLSGMGGDGAYGLAAIRALGGRTLAQDGSTCVVPEMPARAVALGAVEHELPVERIAAALAGLAARAETAWRMAR